MAIKCAATIAIRKNLLAMLFSLQHEKWTNVASSFFTDANCGASSSIQVSISVLVVGFW